MATNRPMKKFVADYAADAQILATNGWLYHLACMNNGLAAFWLQVWDVSAKANCGNAATPYADFEVEVPAGSILAIPMHRDGWWMGNGIYVRAVTGSDGGTLIAGNNAKFTAQYDGPWIS